VLDRRPSLNVCSPLPPVLAPVSDAHGLPRRPFLSTRHAASLMLAEGVPVKVVRVVLGNSLLSTTAGTYGRLAPAAFDEAADAMERALTGTDGRLSCSPP